MVTQNNKQYDVAIMGMGVRNIAHTTFEFVRVLKECELGFVVSLDQKSVDAFSSSLSSLSVEGKSLPPLVSLVETYKADRIRHENYQEAAKVVLDATADNRPVAYITPGNPVTFDRVAQELISGCVQRGLRFKVIPAISFIDTILVDLQQELAPGMQTYEASWFVGMNIRPDTRLSCLLVQTSTFATSYPILDGRHPKKSALMSLKEYLLKFYPDEHLVALVRSGISWDDSANICPVKIGDLDNISSLDQLGASMFIPPLQEAVIEQDFLSAMADTDNLESMYPKT